MPPNSSDAAGPAGRDHLLVHAVALDRPAAVESTAPWPRRDSLGSSAIDALAEDDPHGVVVAEVQHHALLRTNVEMQMTNE